MFMIHSRPTRIFFISLAAVTLLSGCENMKKSWDGMKWPEFVMKPKTAQQQPANCPEVGTMPDLGRLTQIRENQVLSETILESVKPACTVDAAQATVRLAIGFKGKLGPAGMKEASTEVTYSLPYLIAVVNPEGNIISKDVFAINMVYKGGQTEIAFNDLLEQIIPLKTGEKVTNYKILVGFQLDDEQLEYNRRSAAGSPSN